MEIRDGWWVAGGVVVFILGMFFGATAMSDAFKDDCDTMGKRRIKEVVYTCARQ